MKSKDEKRLEAIIRMEQNVSDYNIAIGEVKANGKAIIRGVSFTTVDSLEKKIKAHKSVIKLTQANIKEY